MSSLRSSCSRYRFALFLAVSCAGACWADITSLPPPDTLSLRTGSTPIAQLPDVLRRDDPVREEGVFVLVLRDAMNEATSNALALAGVRVLEYLPHNAFVVDLRGASMKSLRESNVARSLHRYDNAWKIDPLLLPGAQQPAWTDPQRIALATTQNALLVVTLHRFRGAARTLQALKQLPDRHIVSLEHMTGGWVIGLRSPLASVPALAQLPDVAYIEHAPEFALRSNASTRWVVQTNLQNNESIHARGITGTGQVGGLIDGPLAHEHCSFIDTLNPVGPAHRKILAYNSAFGYSPHGTHVGATFLGNDLSNGNGRGIAPDARVVYNTFPSFGELNVYNRFDLHRTQGAAVHNNSWGSDAFSNYESTCRAVDSFSYDHETNLLVFAVSDSATLHIPELSKNALAVSSTDAAPLQSNMCVLPGTGGPAGGPTFDGRRKPDVVAPGCDIVSASGATGCGFAASSGSSMAAPAVAGLALLMREYFTRGFHPSGSANASDAIVPSGALLRAMIANCATDVSGQTGYPSNREGWGRVLGENSLYFAGETRRLFVKDARRTDTDALQTGQLREFRLYVQSSAEPLRVTLAFTDFPGAIASSFPVVNNLDLEVISPAGTIYRGNILSGGQSVTGGAADPVNNIEQVILNTPATGVWRARVLGAQVNIGPQGFALVATGNVLDASCDSIDFNNDGLTPDTMDIDDFLSVWMGGPCSTDPSPGCSDLDFNNDALFPDTLDIESFLSVFAGGACL